MQAKPVTPAESLIKVRGLRKQFGTVTALRGVDLDVTRGEVLGLLGPNGAGKTTLINILTTLVRPDGGHASIAGRDVVADAASVRALIGVTGQFAALDELLTARETLTMFGRLMRLPRREARRRAEDLLGAFDLADAADRPVKGFSGGMRKRLDLAASMVVDSVVLFLDEPTTGLDARSRAALWAVVQGQQDRGITILLTTQYLEEADRLADRIVVINQGEVIAEGTATELKNQVGGASCVVRLADPGTEPAAREALAGLGDVGSGAPGELVVAAPDGPATLADVLRRIEAASLVLADITLRRPTLDDVFLALTGHLTEQPDLAGHPAAR